jgi:hypothetical protein
MPYRWSEAPITFSQAD